MKVYHTDWTVPACQIIKLACQARCTEYSDTCSIHSIYPPPPSPLELIKIQVLFDKLYKKASQAVKIPVFSLFGPSARSSFLPDWISNCLQTFSVKLCITGQAARLSNSTACLIKQQLLTKAS